MLEEHAKGAHGGILFTVFLQFVDSRRQKLYDLIPQCGILSAFESTLVFKVADNYLEVCLIVVLNEFS